MYIDIHSHHPSKSNSIAIQNLTISEAQTLYSLNKNAYYSVGIHPWFANQCAIRCFQQLDVLAMDKNVVAIGECGLDKNIAVPMSVQLAVFERQIELSEKIGKPLIIHCVGCYNELFEIKRRRMPTQLWIIHGFRGKPELAKQALQLNCALSFGINYPTESVKITPIDKLYLETDESTRSIEEIYEQISIIKACKVEDLSAGKEFIAHHQLN
jgi:TatD DNase family protein